jgi:hypothetical protein
MIGALGGALGGGMLGQLTDTLGIPRRAVLGLLGQGLAGRDDIDSGSALLEALGASPGGLLSSLGGFGTDVLADPLTYGGMILGALGEAGTAGRATESLANADRMQKAASAARAANEARGAEFGTESLQRLGRAVTPEDIAAASPRTGLYGFNPQRQGGTVSPNVAIPPEVAAPPRLNAVPGGQGAIAPVAQGGGLVQPQIAPGTPRGVVNQARQAAMAANAGGNDRMMLDALSRLGEPFEAGGGRIGEMTLPGQLLAPGSPLRGNPLMRMEPNAAMQGIEPLLASLMQRKPGGGLSPWDMVLGGSMGGGAIGSGIYAGSRGR